MSRHLLLFATHQRPQPNGVGSRGGRPQSSHRDILYTNLMVAASFARTPGDARPSIRTTNLVAAASLTKTGRIQTLVAPKAVQPENKRLPRYGLLFELPSGWVQVLLE